MDVSETDFDLTPRHVPAPKRRRWPVLTVVVVLIAVFGFLVYKGLGDATLYFYNADEAVAKKAQLDDHRFRLQGTVEPGTVKDTGDGVDFTVTFNGVEVGVAHRGDPPQLFQENIPVVVEGQWDGDTFDSDKIIVKHSESYVARDDYQEREREANTGGTAPPGAP
jgi:cytochrome c-type biogenesis protein CcmE